MSCKKVSKMRKRLGSEVTSGGSVVAVGGKDDVLEFSFQQLLMNMSDVFCNGLFTTML